MKKHPESGFACVRRGKSVFWKKILFGQKYPAKNYLGITEGENEMKDEKISNYVKLCEDWADKFMKMDQENLRKRVPELKEENGLLKTLMWKK